MTSLARTPHFIGCILQSDSEELATQASRRMDATRGVAAILRDARKGALLRMRSTSVAGPLVVQAPPPLHGASFRPILQKRELLRFARKRNLETRARQNNPTGKSPKTLSSPSDKNIPLNPSGKSVFWLRVSHPMRGAGRDRHERAVGCGGREGGE
jgi:hypothetical protein